MNPWLLVLVPVVFVIAVWALVDYESFWFTLEFWLPPDKRRPFTYIMRDLYHQAAGFVVPTLGFGFTAVGIWLASAFPEWKWVIFGLVAAGWFPGALVAHLFWGKDYVPGEMPPPKTYQPTARVILWQKKLY